MTDNTQPEALRLADELEAEFAQWSISNHTCRKAATELLRQHARIAELEAIAASVGSGLVARQSIETAPKDGTRILLHPAVEVHDAWSKGHWSEQQKCWIVGGSASGVTHTHWIPLPPHPATYAGSGKGE